MPATLLSIVIMQVGVLWACISLPGLQRTRCICPEVACSDSIPMAQVLKAVMDRLMDLEDKVRSSAVACICDAAVKNLQVGRANSVPGPSLSAT